MHEVQVNNPTPDFLGWHAVEVINEIEAGWCYAVTSRSLECMTSAEALAIARLVAQNTGAQTAAFDKATGQRIIVNQEGGKG